MIDTESSDPDHIATTVRLRYLVPGLALRISELRDALGGYSSEVVGVDDDAIWIALPIRRDGMLSLQSGQLVSVRFERPGDASYLFDSVVAHIQTDDRAPFGLALPVTIARRPHRTDARLALVLDAGYQRADGGSGSGKIVDLSAGGVGLICADEIRPGDELTVRCELPGPGRPLALEHRTEVCSATMYGRTPGGVTLHQYGLRFLDADIESRERILATVIWNLTENPEVV